MPATLSDIQDTMINMTAWVLFSQSYNASGTKLVATMALGTISERDYE